MNKFPAGCHNRFGKWDNNGAWYPDEEIKNLPGAFNVRVPSRKYPYSYIKHFYTKKFWKIFSNSFPKEVEKIIANEMKIRMCRT